MFRHQESGEAAWSRQRNSFRTSPSTQGMVNRVADLGLWAPRVLLAFIEEERAHPEPLLAVVATSTHLGAFGAGGTLPLGSQGRLHSLSLPISRHSQNGNLGVLMTYCLP